MLPSAAQPLSCRGRARYDIADSNDGLQDALASQVCCPLASSEPQASQGSGFACRCLQCRKRSAFIEIFSNIESQLRILRFTSITSYKHSCGAVSIMLAVAAWLNTPTMTLSASDKICIGIARSALCVSAVRAIVQPGLAQVTSLVGWLMS